MVPRKDITLSLIAFLLATSIIVGLTLVLKNTVMLNNLTNTNPKPLSSTVSIEPQNRISIGDKILISKEEINDKNPQFGAAKQRGVEAMAAGDYEKATAEFEKAIQNYRNAPETLIYLNNARIGKSKAYTIAIVAPIGADVDSALKLLRGLAQAQNEINQAGKINGIPLKVVIADDQGKPESAKQIATELAKNPEILGVIGHHSSGTSLAAREVYESEKLVAISSTSTSVKLSELSPKSPTRYVFRTVPSDAFAAKALAKYMLETLKKRKAAVFYDSKSAYSNSLKEEFIKEIVQNTGVFVGEFNLSDDNFNAFRSVQQATKNGAQVLMLAAPYDQLKQTLSVINVNDKRLNILGGDDTYDIRILQEGGDRAQGMVVAMAWHRDANRNSVFVKSSKNLWNADVDWKTAMTYDASQALIAALKRNPSRNGVQQALSDPDFKTPGVSDTIRFVSSSGDRIGRVQLVQVKAVPDSTSGTGYSFVPLP